MADSEQEGTLVKDVFHGQDIELLRRLHDKAKWLRRETLRIHQLAPETRIASCLSDVEVFVALYYGGILKYDPRNPRWEERDRLVVSKGGSRFTRSSRTWDSSRRRNSLACASRAHSLAPSRTS